MGKGFQFTCCQKHFATYTFDYHPIGKHHKPNKQNTEHMFINMHRMHKEKTMLICLSLCSKKGKMEETKMFASAGRCVNGFKENGTFRLAASTSTKLKGKDPVKDDAGETLPVSQICGKYPHSIREESRILPAFASRWP